MKISEIDIARIGLGAKGDPTVDDYSAVGKELFDAFESTGFAYITGHGVSQGLVTDCMNISQQFFHLPKSEKDKFERDENIHQGYVEPGREVFTDTTLEVPSSAIFLGRVTNGGF